MRNERTRLLHRMERLAQCRVNDAVKLAFLDEGQLEKIDGLELGALKEFKLEKLVELSGGQENKAEEFFRALKENADAV